MSTPVTPDPHHLPVLPQSPAGPVPRPVTQMSTLAGWLLLLVPALVFLAMPFFVGHEELGRATSFRDAPMALLIGLAGLRITAGLGRHTISAVLAGIGGVGLLFSAILAEHGSVGVTVTEAFCGVFAVVVASTSGLESIRSR